MAEHFVEHHTLRGRFTLASGETSDTYVDLRAALLCGECAYYMAGFYDSAVSEIAGFSVALVATGAFGAGLLVELRSWEATLLWNPKGHGVEWSGDPGDATDAVLLDDVATTGGTLAAMRAATEARGLTVVGEIVAVDRRA